MKLRRLAKTAEKLLRIARMRTLGCAREFAWTRTRLNLPRNEPFSIRSSHEDGVRVRLVDPEETITRALPHMPGEPGVHPAFAREQTVTAPASYVAELRGGRFWGYYGGSVFTARGSLLPDLSKDVWGPDLHSAYVRPRLPPPTPLPGHTLSLVTPEALNNYHHWTIDLLPRAGLVERAGYNLSQFDHILIKDRKLPYQRESFRRLGLDPRKLIEVGDDMHFVAETLVVPSLHNDNTRVNSRDLQYSRNLYLPLDPPPEKAKRRLYVSRRDAAFRRISNEAEMMPLLKRHGFEEVAMSEMSVVQQARLFGETAIILGPNGSALANLVFANRACRVIELFAPGWVVRYNWMIAAGIGLDYTALIGAGSRPPADALPSELKQDIVVDVALLERVLSEVTSSA